MDEDQQQQGGAGLQQQQRSGKMQLGEFWPQGKWTEEYFFPYNILYIAHCMRNALEKYTLETAGIFDTECRTHNSKMWYY